MEEFKFFKELLIILGFSIPVIYIFNIIKFPSIVGFLITGIIIGPYGLKLITDIAGIQFMAEIGVALLLFTIGIEIPLSRFLMHLKAILLTGGLQVLCTFMAGLVIGLALQLSISQSIFIGFILTHSSSALIMKLLKDKSDEESSQGRISLGIILFQDVIVVAMMLMIPFLSGGQELNTWAIIWKLLQSTIIIILILAVGRYFIPIILEKLVKMQMRDVFVITSVVTILGIAWVTKSLGLSLAIGAFLAGLALSDSDFTHQIISDINPFRDLFLSIFFVSFGMILDLNFLFANPHYVILASVFIIVIKATIVFGLVKMLGYPLRAALLSGAYLSQIGEFSFVLAAQGFKSNIISGFIYQGFIGASFLTFIVTPLLISATYFFLNRRKTSLHTEVDRRNHSLHISNHVIICGMGLNGRNLVKVLKDTAINYVIIDINFQKIQNSKDKGDKNTIWGDASNAEILRRANVETARVMVIALSDRFLTKRCLANAKAINPDLHVIVRTKYTADIEDLLSLGANDVIPEEFETSIQIFGRVLKMFHIPNSIILAQGNIIRNKGYGIFREVRYTEEAFEQISQILAQGTIETYYVTPESQIIGKSIREINLKAQSGAMIINIIRDNQTITNPPSEFVFQQADQLIIFGSHSAIDMGIKILNGGENDSI